jgi:hypothetical protein
MLLICQENGTFRALQDIGAQAQGGLLLTHDNLGVVRPGDDFEVGQVSGRPPNEIYEHEDFSLASPFVGTSRITAESHRCHEAA